MPRPRKHFYDFGPFSLEPAGRVLWREAKRIPLSPKAFDVLLALVRRTGEVVSSDELLNEVWPEIHVEGENVKVTVSGLRKALGDDLRNGDRIIETVPRRGYRLIPPVTERWEDTPVAATPGAAQTVASVPGSTAEPPPGGESTCELASGAADAAPASVAPLERTSVSSVTVRSRRRWPYAVALAVLLAAIIVVWPYRPLPPPEVVSVEQLTHDGRQKGGPLFTDGSRVYFRESTPQGSTLSYVAATGGETVHVATPLGPLDPFELSPDGSKLLAATDSTEQNAWPLWVLPIAGGSPRRLDGILAGSAAWSPDGGRIAYIYGTSLFTASSDGSDIRKLANVPSAAGGLSWSPDGRWLRFTVSTGTPPKNLPWEIREDGSGLRRILAGWNGLGKDFHGSWALDGRYYVFSVVTGPAAKSFGALWAQREVNGVFVRFSREPARLIDDGRSYNAPVVSRDGKKVFVIGEDRTGELVKYDARAGAFISYLDGLEARWVTFSPDGR